MSGRGALVHGCVPPGGYGVPQAILAIPPWADVGFQSGLLQQVCHLQILEASTQALVQVRVVALQDACATTAVEYQHVASASGSLHNGLIHVCTVHVAQ